MNAPIKFNVPMHGSVGWVWDGIAYTLSYTDSRLLDSLYKGGHPHGPTHGQKLKLMAKHGWEFCTHTATSIHCRSPR